MNPQNTLTGDLFSVLQENDELKRRVQELESRRKFGLVWEDQIEAVQEQMQEELPILRHEPNRDIEGAVPNPERPHLLIEGDNLHALTCLQATHKNAIDVIYIDPPYNTGNEFIYNDRLVKKDDSFRHSAWLSFMHKRLTLARELLKDTGVIFISIDDNEHAHLRMLCDLVFGPDGVIGDLVVVNNLKGRSDAKHFATAHETLLVCARDRSAAQIFGVALNEDQVAEYRESDSIGRWKPVGLQKTGKGSRREDRPGMYYPIYWDPEKDTLALERQSENEEVILPLFADGTQGRWRWGKDRFAQSAATELVVKRQARGPVVYVKMRLEGDGGYKRIARPKSIWIDPKYDSGSGTRMIKDLFGAKVFDNPKPLDFIVDILKVSASADAVVLDFFAGSGTTTHAIAQLNAEDGGTRQCILVTNNENGICRNVTQPRMKAVLSGRWADGKPHDPLPGSLKFLSTGFIKHTDAAGRRISTDALRRDLARHSAEFVSLRESAFVEAWSEDWLTVWHGGGKTVAVAAGTEIDFDLLSYAREHADGCVREGDERIVYAFTTAERGVDPDTRRVWEGWDVRPLPHDILAALRRAAPVRKRKPQVEKPPTDVSDDGGLF